MKLRLGLAMALAATALVGACDKKADVPAEPAKVEAPIAAPVNEPAKTPEAAKVEATNKTATTASARMPSTPGRYAPSWPVTARTVPV